MKKAIFAVLLLLATTAPAGAQQVDSCLKIEFPDHYYDTLYHETYSNRDSVLVDSCTGSPTYLELYATKWWVINFSYYVIKRHSAPYDTTIEMSWTAIDTAYSALRTAFSALESKYGTLHLKEDYPDIVDSTVTGSDWYFLRFDNYVCTDSVDADVVTFPDLDTFSNGSPYVGFISAPKLYDGVQTNEIGAEAMTIMPNPSSTSLTIRRLDGQPIRHIELFDMLGKCVFERQYRGSDELTIDIRSIMSGSYIILCDDVLKSRVIITR